MEELAITIQYKLVDEPDWKSLNLAPNVYFDMEQGEEPAFDATPKLNHAIEYLAFDPAQVQFTILSVQDHLTDRRKVVTETFWNRGRNRIIEVRDFESDRTHSELIVDIITKECPLTSEIIRAWKDDGIWFLAYHVLITRNDDGTESETKIYPVE